MDSLYPCCSPLYRVFDYANALYRLIDSHTVSQRVSLAAESATETRRQRGAAKKCYAFFPYSNENCVFLSSRFFFFIIGPHQRCRRRRRRRLRSEHKSKTKQLAINADFVVVVVVALLFLVCCKNKMRRKKNAVETLPRDSWPLPLYDNYNNYNYNDNKKYFYTYLLIYICMFYCICI